MSASARRSRRLRCAAAASAAMLITACSSPEAVLQQASSAAVAQSAAFAPSDTPLDTASDPPSDWPSDKPRETPSATPDSGSVPESASAALPGPRVPDPQDFTIAFAGDVHFAERTADRLAADPATAFGVAAPGLAAADLTVVNLETAITTRGEPEPKSYTFRAPPTAFDALRDAGVDVASMANNHGADYGAVGIQDSLGAIAASGFPVIGFGADAAAAYAPLHRTIRGVDVAIFAASQVRDHTLDTWSATATSPGIANAFDPTLIDNVKAAVAAGSTVVVFLHWGTEYESCPNTDQQQLADQLAAAGVTAVIGTHAHVLQGAGWRPDGVYVAYGLSNYLWWRSFGNEQDDNGVLTLTFKGTDVVGTHFAPAHLDDTGVPVPATGAEADRINAQWEQVRRCADLAAAPPG